MLQIKDLNLQELEQCLTSWGEPLFRAKQVFAWIYQKKAEGFSEMSDLPAALRERLERSFSLKSLEVSRALKSVDGTEKFLFRLKDGNLIEAVSIPTEKRVTGCISSQAGCKYACVFCASGMAGFKRNLGVAEIIEQALFLAKSSAGRKLTHLVFMGTGEPLDNYEHLLKAIRIINFSQGMNVGARRITISTSGLVPGIKRLASEKIQLELSVSLHAPNDAIRSRLMPINKKYPLKELLGACRDYFKLTNRQVTFEYTLIREINSGLQNARELGKILKGLNCKVNLIPVNPVRDPRFQPPEKIEIIRFQKELLSRGVTVTLRVPRGQDIDAACGQLRLKFTGCPGKEKKEGPDA
ncbi:MAG: 23S rRNA (adenine(2503)-C(2))-methyltransferase RlmN [Candidatus Omnitrophica bacterium]|nr:23S rRNA (adenine(2503)-C(2))-methyltransferase RlmN [Candidatus Omnitrophota bacterium]